MRTKEYVTSNFARCVPEALRSKLRNFAKYAKSNFISEYEGAGMGKDSYGCASITAIYGYDMSGYFAAQNGGYEVSEFYSDVQSSGAYFSQGEREAAEKQHTFRLESFAHDTLNLEWGAAEKWAKAFDWNALSAETQEALQEYENECSQPVLLRFVIYLERDKARLWEDGASVGIMLRLSCNYTDAPYYRDTNDETLCEMSFTVQEFMHLDDAEILERFKRKQRNDKNAR